jgi:serine/threonine-protein kinase
MGAVQVVKHQPMNPTADVDLVHHALQRVRQSRELRRAPALQRLLTFLGDTALAGRAEELKESVLGVEVFHRAPGYDVRADPIVRVQANRLRRKLEAYYAAEGANDYLRISLPRGAYVLALEPRATARIQVPDPSPARPIRLMVLPFANLTGRADRELFCDGLTEELIHRLSGLPSLRVLGRTTAFALKGAAWDVARLRERFAVEVLIEGAVRQCAQGVRVPLRFIAAPTESCLWSGAFERPLDQALRLHDDIAAAVSHQLKLQTTGSSTGPAQVLPPAAHEAFLLGRYFYIAGGQSRLPIRPATFSA